METGAPNFYTDSVSLQLGPFGALLQFMLAEPASAEGMVNTHVKIANVRMSLEHAKVLAIMLNREVRKFEDQVKGTIPLHPQIVEKMGISPEEWR